MSDRKPIARLKQKILEREGHWRLFRSNRHLARKARPKPGQPVVAFFAHSTRLTHMSLNAAFAYLTAGGLQMAGLPVVYWACESGMNPCVLGTDRENPNNPPPCKGCVAESGRLFLHAPTIWFKYSEDPELARRLAGLSIERLSNFETAAPAGVGEGAVIPLGSLVLPSVRWILRRHTLLDDEPTRFILRRYLLSAWNVASQFDLFISNVQPEVVIVFNGIMYPEATARWIALRRGVRVITHEVGFQPFSAFFSQGQATAYPIEIPRDFELSEDQDQRLDAYLEQRFQGKFTMAGIQFWPEMRGLDETFNERASQFEQIVPVFTNVVYDTSQVHANTVFPHMFAWLDLVRQIVEGHPETFFVLRAHPDELRAGKESRESVPGWVADQRLEELPNVLFVHPNEYLSSYELIQRSKFVMVYNSSIGLEAAVMGKAVLCGGRARYTSLPTVYFPESPEAYARMADKLLDAPGTLRAPEEFIRNARRFIYYQLYKASLPFGDFLEEDVLPGYVRLKPFRIEELSPERFPTMKAIQDGLLHDNQFLLDDN